MADAAVRQTGNITMECSMGLIKAVVNQPGKIFGDNWQPVWTGH